MHKNKIILSFKSLGAEVLTKRDVVGDKWLTIFDLIKSELIFRREFTVAMTSVFTSYS